MCEEKYTLEITGVLLKWIKSVPSQKRYVEYAEDVDELKAAQQVLKIMLEEIGDEVTQMINETPF